MSVKSSALRLVLEKAGNTDWSINDVKRKVKPAKPEMLEVRVGSLRSFTKFSVLVPSYPGSRILKAFLVSPISTYFADLSEGIVIVVEFGERDKLVQIEQRRIIEVYDDFMFVYNDDVDAWQTSVKGGIATFVIPSFSGANRFAVWVHDNMYFWFTFFWKVNKMEMEGIVSSMKPVLQLSNGK